jgi:UDP-N-acetylglucosamine diphosphorylase/glucosamine-1-phosphate N-acetyltransferase
MKSTVCLFEDDGYRNLLPLTHTRPVYHLRCGTGSLAEKILQIYQPSRICGHCRPQLAEVLAQVMPGETINRVAGDVCLLINGRLLATTDLPEKIPLGGQDCLYTRGDTLVAARISGDHLKKLNEAIGRGPLGAHLFAIDHTEEVDLPLITYPWDLVYCNGHQIGIDWDLFGYQAGLRGQVDDGVMMLGQDNIFVDEGARIKPGAVLDAEGGPIIISAGAKVFPNATIEGPTFVGPKSLIKMGAKIYEGTTIGEVCKVGGEVEKSIIHSYSNKQHDGFLGHAYLGMWVNLGADTNNSDLKNNYGHVKVYVDGRMIDTGLMFVGLTMGDHSKSSINTMFNTGTMVGVCCNVYGGGFPPKFVPSFSWVGSHGMEEHRFDKAMETARAVMARRKVELTAVEEKLLGEIFSETAAQRTMLKYSQGIDLP